MWIRCAWAQSTTGAVRLAAASPTASTAGAKMMVQSNTQRRDPLITGNIRTGTERSKNSGILHITSFENLSYIQSFGFDLAWH